MNDIVDIVVIKEKGKPYREINVTPVNDLMDCIQSDEGLTKIMDKFDKLDKEQVRWAFSSLISEYRGLKHLYTFMCERLGEEKIQTLKVAWYRDLRVLNSIFDNLKIVT